jgi:hypothetical protein
MVKRTAPAIRLNKHLELNGKPAANPNPSLGLIPNLGFRPGDTRAVKLSKVEDPDEIAEDECEINDDCQE